MKRRLNFGCGIVHRPQVLLLDEPTVGVDPQSRVRLLDLVREQAARGTCVLYTTHYMEEAQQLCDRHRPSSTTAASSRSARSNELRRLLGERDILRLAGHFEPEAARRAAVARLAGCARSARRRRGADRSPCPRRSRHLPAIFAALAEAGADVRETVLTQPSLESLFIKLTGRELRE